MLSQWTACSMLRSQTAAFPVLRGQPPAPSGCSFLSFHYYKCCKRQWRIFNGLAGLTYTICQTLRTKWPVNNTETVNNDFILLKLPAVHPSIAFPSLTLKIQIQAKETKQNAELVLLHYTMCYSQFLGTPQLGTAHSG